MRRFLQGLGIGLLVAAIVMGINTRSNGSMADESIVEKAQALGMVFPQGTKTPLQIEDDEKEPEQPDKEADASSGGAVGVGATGDGTDASSDKEEKEKEEATEKPAPTSTPKPTKKPKKSSKPKGTVDPDATPTPSHKSLPKGTVVNFRVRSGLLSSSIARDLYEAGIIDDLWAFDHYIEEHGLGHNIITGTYELTVGDSYAKIARIITHSD